VSTASPNVDTEQGREIQKLKEQVSAISTAQAVTREVLVERIDSVKAIVQELANRPPPGVPIWVVLVMAVPPMLTAMGVIVLATYTVLR
jgi:Tfp pilus assembly protein PilN